MKIGNYYYIEGSEEIFQLAVVSGDDLSVYVNVGLVSVIDQTLYSGVVQVHWSVEELDEEEFNQLTDGQEFIQTEHESEY